MKWFKSQRQEAVGPEAFIAFLLRITCDVVKDASQTLEKHVNAAERSKLPKVEEELLFFFVFALDYWIQTGTARTQEERRILRQAFHAHLAKIAGGGCEEQAELNTYQERFTAYGQIVNETKGDNARFLGFGMKLSEFCGMPNNPFLLVLAPDLFTQALGSLVRLESVQLKLS